MEIQGKIYKIDAVKEFASGFKKRTIVVESGKDFFLIALTGDDISLIDMYSVGESISVSANVTGRKYLNKDNTEMFFTDISGKIKVEQEKSMIAQAQKGLEDMTPKPIEIPKTVNDDLPF